MPSHDALLREIGALIRDRRTVAGLTQEALGARADIVGKYVSEIERGTRDVPMSTLLAIVEGLGLELDVKFKARGGVKERTRQPLPRAVEDIARELASLPADRRGRVLAAIRAVLAIARSG